MASATKRNKAIREQVETGKVYTIDEALALLKKISSVKFRESVDVAIKLGVDRLTLRELEKPFRDCSKARWR